MSWKIEVGERVGVLASGAPEFRWRKLPLREERPSDKELGQLRQLHRHVRVSNGAITITLFPRYAAMEAML